MNNLMCLPKLNADDYALMREELAKLRTEQGLRAWGDTRRFKAVKRELARKYTVKPVKGLKGAILGVYGLYLETVRYCYERLSAWNREG